MTTVAARVMNQMIVGYVPHTSVDGETWNFIAYGVSTANGAAGGTTIINGSLGGSDNDWNGRWWIKVTSGSAQGEWRRIVDYATATGTFTLEDAGFTSRIDSGVSYELWKSPEPVVLVDSSSGETNMVDAIRTEADVDLAEFWDGYWACPITGTHRGKKAEITGFDPGTGAFILVAGFGSALAAGDVVLLRKFIEVSDLSMPDGAQEYHPRPADRVNHAKGDGFPGARAGEVSFTSHIYGSGTLAANGVAANGSVLSGLFEACGFEEQIGATATVSGGSSTTTTIDIIAGTYENFDIGQFVMWNGNVTRIESMVDGTPDQILVNPPLPSAPATGDLVYGMRNYKKSIDSDVLGVFIEMERDGLRVSASGCKGVVTFTEGPVCTFGWSFQADHWSHEVAAAPYNPNTAYTSQPPILGSEKVFHVDNTKTNSKGLTASPNGTMVAKAVNGKDGVNGRAGFHLTAYAATMTFREIIGTSDELSAYLRYTARTAVKLVAQYGANANAFAIAMPVSRCIEAPKIEDGDGLAETPSVFEAQDAGLAQRATGGVPDTTIVKVPDFLFALT